MNPNEELIQWLNRPEKSLKENLIFGNKVFVANEFPVPSKYSIIASFFCDNLDKYRKAIRKSGEEFDAAWEIPINQFLRQQYPRSRMPEELQRRLIDTFIHVAEKLVSPPRKSVAESFNLLVKSESLGVFYRRNKDYYAKIIGAKLRYQRHIWLALGDEFKLEKERDNVEEWLEEVDSFVRAIVFAPEHRSVFHRELLTPFVEFMLFLGEHEKEEEEDFIKEMFDVLQKWMFAENDLENYRKLLYGHRLPEVINLFDTSIVPNYAFLAIIEAFVITYRQLVPDLLQFLFQNVLRPANSTLSPKECLVRLRSVFCILKKRNVIVKKPEIADEFDIVEFLRDEVEQIASEYYEEYLDEVLALLVTIMDFNPIILERRAFAILINCFFMPKTSIMQHKFEIFLCNTIRMTHELRRGEFFVVYLMKALREKLELFEIPKKLRKKAILDEEMVETSTPVLEPFMAFFTPRIQDFSSSVSQTVSMFQEIAYAWPYEVVQAELGRLLSLLTSKQSLYMWRLLIEFLQDELDHLSSQPTENSLFLIDLICAILCQYFVSNHLAEYSTLFWDLIEERCDATRNTLARFGRALLYQEHNRRLVNAFLFTAYEFASFEELLYYYTPDSLIRADDKELALLYPDLPHVDARRKGRNLHSYLEADEWTLIEQRVKNFGRGDCKRNFGRVMLQRIHSALLFGDDKLLRKIWPMVAGQLAEDQDQMKRVLREENVTEWLLALLDQRECRVLASCAVREGLKERIGDSLLENADFVEALIVEVFKALAGTFEGEEAILRQIDFEKVILTRVEALGDIKSLIEANLDAKKPKLDREETNHYLDSLRQLPVSFVSVEAKEITFGLFLSLFLDLQRAGGEADLQQKLIEMFTEMFHFEEFPDVFSHFNISLLLQIFADLKRCEPILHLIFNQSIFYMSEASLENFKVLIKRFKKEKSIEKFEVCTMVLRCFLSIHYVRLIKVPKESIDELQQKYFTVMLSFLQNADRTPEFLNQTSNGFLALLSFHFQTKGRSEEQLHDLIALLSDYLTTELTTEGLHFSTVVLEHRVKLNLSPEHTNELVELQWRQFERLVRLETSDSAQPEDEKRSRAIHSAAALIYEIKSTSELDELFDRSFAALIPNRDLPDIGPINKIESTDDLKEFFDRLASLVPNSLQSDADCRFITRSLAIFAEYGVSRSKTKEANRKNAAFGRHYADLMAQIVFRRLMYGTLLNNLPVIRDVISAHTAFAANTRLPLSDGLLDDMYYLLADVRIGRFSIAADCANVPTFAELHRLIAEFLFVLAARRPEQAMETVHVFTQLVKALLAGISLFRVDRKTDEPLDAGQVTLLADLTHKVEKVVNLAAKNEQRMKPLAAILIIDVIDIMICHRRSSTVHDKVKNAFKNICFILIGLLDEFFHKFVLRNCPDAHREVYQMLFKEYNRYKAFKGKV